MELSHPRFASFDEFISSTVPLIVLGGRLEICENLEFHSIFVRRVVSGGLSGNGNRVLLVNLLVRRVVLADSFRFRVCQAYCCQACPTTAEDTMPR